MTVLTIDSRAVRLRLPVLRLGRLRGTIIVELSERAELRIEGREIRARDGRTAGAAEARLDAYRTEALGVRLGAGF
ncbi:hypothetical protein J4G33_04180 [Actinotalea sp. BY-33]|uniref:Uncharacterized protein n=1 Tax=Actinotalea soli TaxID=2819234 RepID=A0A939LQ94_9CELL|nr:hypothetical protein [Actinotalea soli]MBO1750995.1 hypothetical protein [Actinotalea soli]